VIGFPSARRCADTAFWETRPTCLTSDIIVAKPMSRSSLQLRELRLDILQLDRLGRVSQDDAARGPHLPGARNNLPHLARKSYCAVIAY
jgi:hypothetical protein